MEDLGGEDDRAKRLGEVNVENPERPTRSSESTPADCTAGLVHGDLSEYNLVVQEGELCVVDLGQAVTVHTPTAASSWNGTATTSPRSSAGRAWRCPTRRHWST